MKIMSWADSGIQLLSRYSALFQIETSSIQNLYPSTFIVFSCRPFIFDQLTAQDGLSKDRLSNHMGPAFIFMVDVVTVVQSVWFNQMVKSLDSGEFFYQKCSCGIIRKISPAECNRLVLIYQLISGLFCRNASFRFTLLFFYLSSNKFDYLLHKLHILFLLHILFEKV